MIYCPAIREGAHNPTWLHDVVNETEHLKRINNVVAIKNYLLRLHKILNRPDYKLNGETFTTAKIVLNTVASMVNFHTAYVVGKPVSITGTQEGTKAFSQVYKRGIYRKTDYMIMQDLTRYGNAFEYVYLDGSTIKSKIINNTESYPVYDENENYVAFVEYWQEFVSSDTKYVVYTPEMVQVWKNNELIEEHVNLTGLPIHYADMNKTEYDFFGDPMLNNVIPVMDSIEYLLSKLDDAITRLSLNPIGVVTGSRIDNGVSSDIVGNVLNLEDTGKFSYATVAMDYNNIKLELDRLTTELYAIACVPSVLYGQGNVANVSEISLKMLFAQSDNKAQENMTVLIEGFYKRFEYIRKLLALKGVIISDEDYDTLDVKFSLNRPVDTSAMMNDLKTQRDMGAISIESIIDISDYTNDTTLELDRLSKEVRPMDTLEPTTIT